MMLVVNAAISVLNARAMTRPTAITTTSPRNRKFLNPLIIRTVLHPRPGACRVSQNDDRRAHMPDDDHISSGHGNQGPKGLTQPRSPHRPQKLTCATLSYSDFIESRGTACGGQWEFPGVWARPGAWPCRAQTSWGEESLPSWLLIWPPYLTPGGGQAVEPLRTLPRLSPAPVVAVRHFPMPAVAR